MAESSSTALQNLIQRLQAGDAGARRELVGRACERLRRLARKLLSDFPRVGHWEEADDVLQNAALRLLGTLESVTPASVTGFFTLAAREMRRELLDLARHYYGPEGHGAIHASTPDVSSSASDPSPPQTTYDPHRLAVWSELHRHVEALPAEEREVFDLLWYHELTQDEAAAALGVSLATLKRRWMSARLRLKAVLQESPRPS